MLAPRFPLGLALAVLALAAPLSAQQVDSIEQDTATLGEVLRVFGTDLGKKPKLVLVQNGAAAKKTKLKVVGNGDTGGDGGGAFVDVELKKGFAGPFAIGVKVKKNVVGESPDTVELVPPTPESVEPEIAQPNDEVVVLVRHYASLGGHVVSVGGKKAKITNVEPADEGVGGLTAVTFKVPKVPSGVWPVSVRNRLGEASLKNALEVTGSTGKLPGVGAKINLVGLKPFKAKKKLIGTDQGQGDPGEINVGLVAGSKKAPKVFGIQMPGQLDELAAGDLFSVADDAEIIYSQAGKKGSLCVWTSAVNEDGEDIVIQVVTIDDEKMVLFVCGQLRYSPEVSNGDCPGPELLSFSGLVTAPSVEQQTTGNGACTPLTTATGSMTGAFDSVPEDAIALFGIAGPGTLKFAVGTASNGEGTPLQLLSWTVTFNPDTDATPATFDSLQIPAATGLSEFTLTMADLTLWSHRYTKQLDSSMSVTITKVVDAPANPHGLKACIHGTFTGTISKGGGPSEVTQTMSGEFEIPYYDSGFGQ
jgi:hypothetical protein